ncbi:hypothetical protein [Millionella massiliensis]|uniref:hypothetical protein n=2 Tax=Millionella massiliensis TaxID=1871023 RepID=UPI0023A8D467|nr:hypothetical protein [Millionella massiliensis]
MQQANSSTLSFYIPAMSGAEWQQNHIAMSHISDLLKKRATPIVSKMPDTFTTRQFIWGLAEMYEVDYVEMLIEAYNGRENTEPRIFHNLHSQIGRYLQIHATDLGIASNGIKIPETNPFGRETSTEQWNKQHVQSKE